jgi:hypothetical protein
MYIIVALRSKRKNDRKNDGADNQKPWAWRPTQAQSHGPVSEAYASRKRSNTRLAAAKTSRADFGSWGMPKTSSMSRSTRAWKIPMTSCDSCPASTAHSPLIPSTRAWACPSSTDRSHPSGGCKLCACSSANIASCTSRPVTCRQRRISNFRLRPMSCFDL